MVRFLSFFVMCASLLALGACSMPLHRNNALVPPMYAHYQKPGKVPDGEDADDIGYAYNPIVNDKSMEIWTNIARDLVVQLDKKFEIKQRQLYLYPYSRPNVFTNSYDAALRQALTEDGFVLPRQNHKVVTVFYEAFPLRSKVKVSDNLQWYEFRLTAVYQGRRLDHVSVRDLLPAFYGQTYTPRVPQFAAASYMQKVDMPWIVRDLEPNQSPYDIPEKARDEALDEDAWVAQTLPDETLDINTTLVKQVVWEDAVSASDSVGSYVPSVTSGAIVPPDGVLLPENTNLYTLADPAAYVSEEKVVISAPAPVSAPTPVVVAPNLHALPFKPVQVDWGYASPYENQSMTE